MGFGDSSVRTSTVNSTPPPPSPSFFSALYLSIALASFHQKLCCESSLTLRWALTASSPLSPPPQPATEDALVASLLSRISGLSTNATPFVPASSPSTTSTTSQPSTSQATQPSAAQSRPKPNTTNPLFGRALAGVKTDRSSPSPTTAPAPVALQEAKKEVKEEKNAGKELLPDKPDGGRKGQMTENIMDDTAGGMSAFL